MPDATEGRRRQTCRRILDAARAIAVADGPDALSMRTLADRVGLSAPALYQYFSGRDAIVDEI
ncbi:MAG: helix-turn-helix transcriptional regulator, partial [Myxococcales bacterium]|nr:helix-turn-helix transcriptional regulator [Myxococcales bacterium]